MLQRTSDEPRIITVHNTKSRHESCSKTKHSTKQCKIQQQQQQTKYDAAGGGKMGASKPPIRPPLTAGRANDERASWKDRVRLTVNRPRTPSSPLASPQCRHGAGRRTKWSSNHPHACVSRIYFPSNQIVVLIVFVYKIKYFSKR